MTTRGKREERIRRSRNTVAAEDLVAVLEAAGFRCRLTRAGHWACVHGGSGASCNFAPAHGRGDRFVLRTYVDKAIDALDKARAWEAEQAKGQS